MINFIVNIHELIMIVVTILSDMFVVVVVLPIVRLLVRMMWVGVVQLFLPEHQTVRRFEVLPVFVRIELRLDQPYNVEDTYQSEKTEPDQRLRRHLRHLLEISGVG